LSLSERAVIMVRLRDGWSYAAIGRELGRDRSVIWREARRNCCEDGTYQSDVAQLKAGQNARRPKEHKLAHKPLARFVESAMDEGWSPQLCSLVLARAFPDDERMQISHETIYQAIYVQGRGHVRQDLSTAVEHRPGQTGQRRTRPGPEQQPVQGRAENLRTPGRSRGPGRTRTLGMRLDPWFGRQQLSDRNLC
jgi:IS30 family transposase